MLFLFYLFIDSWSAPKRTRPPPTPTRSINTLPVKISGSIIIPLLIILAIVASVLFFFIKKKAATQELVDDQRDNSGSLTPDTITEQNDEVPLVPITRTRSNTPRKQQPPEILPLIQNDKEYSYSYSYYEEEEDYYDSESEIKIIRELKPDARDDSSSDSLISLAKVTCDL